MAIIYNFLDYKEPKRKVKKLLILGWIFASLSLLAFLWYKYILIFGICALGVGIFSNYKISKSGLRLIVGSTFIMVVSMFGNMVANTLIKTIVGVFFLMG